MSSYKVCKGHGCNIVIDAPLLDWVQYGMDSSGRKAFADVCEGLRFDLRGLCPLCRAKLEKLAETCMGVIRGGTRSTGGK